MLWFREEAVRDWLVSCAVVAEGRRVKAGVVRRAWEYDMP